MLTYSEAKDLMSTARNPRAGKPLQNNTRLYERTYGYAVKLHATDVVTVLPGNRWEISTGGWDTPTTWKRIRAYAPNFRVLGGGANKSVYVRPNSKDPEPDYPSRTVPKFFNASDPGPEPVKDPEGCEVGSRVAQGGYERVTLTGYRNDLCVRPGEMYARASYDDTHPVRSRDVLLYIDQAFKFGDHTTAAMRRTVRVFDYREESYEPFARTNGVRTEQCPHCKAFDELHRKWDEAYRGAWSGRGGWRLYSRMIEEHGSIKGWKAAYKLDGQQVRAAQKTWREWAARNTIPFRDGLVFDAEGYVLKACADKILKARRAAERARKRINRVSGKLGLDPNVAEWLISFGLTPNKDGTVTLVKAVNDDYESDNGGLYELDSTVIAEDWDPYPKCGQGLHFGPSPQGAASYARAENPRFLKVRVPLDVIVPLDDKCKAPYCYVEGEIPSA